MEDHAAGSHNFGIELRRRRMELDLSQADLAEAINYSKGYLSKIEAGHRRASMEVAQHCDAFLDAGGALLRLVPAPAAPAAAADVAPERRDDDVTIHIRPDGSGEFVAMSRRSLLATTATAMMTWSAATGATPAAATPPTAAAGYAQQLVTLRALGQTSPPSEVFPQAAAAVSALRGRAARSTGTAKATALLLAARHAEYAGWMAQENGDETTSAWWTALAVQLAEEGGDGEMASYALVRTAEIALYKNDSAGMLSAATTAFAQARSARVKAFALQRVAQAHALAHDEPAARRALERAAALSATVAAEAPTGPPLGPSATTDPIRFVRGWCLLDLAKPAEAAEALGPALDALPPGALRARARHGARLALALAKASRPQLDHACAIAEQAIVAARPVDSATIRADLARLQRTLSRWRAEPAVRRINHGLTAVLHVGVSR